jgi:hypothetical protein
MNDIQRLFQIMSERTLELVKDLSANEWVTQTDFDSKHPAWVVGHLSRVREFILLWDGQEAILPMYWDERFGNTKQPITMENSAPIQELLEVFKSTTKKALDVLGRIDDDKFDLPITESYHDFATKRLGIFFEATVHESIHFGQLKTLVKHIKSRRIQQDAQPDAFGAG